MTDLTGVDVMQNFNPVNGYDYGHLLAITIVIKSRLQPALKPAFKENENERSSHRKCGENTAWQF